MQQFLTTLDKAPNEVMFEDTMKAISENYSFNETAFKNGEASNAAGENNGSCQLFSFAKLNNLSESQTLLCFGQYYRDVLNTPEGSDHQNIRQFMLQGWAGISFDNDALTLKS